VKWKFIKKLQKEFEGERVKVFIGIYLLVVVFMSGCSDITGEQIIKKYKENPRKGGLREDIITHDLLPDMREDAKKDLLAIRYAKECFIKATDLKDAEVCRVSIVQKYGNEYSFEPFKEWNSEKKEQVLDFLNYNEKSAECYSKAKKARDILPCYEPKDPDF
jgi:hypothetical protein